MDVSLYHLLMLFSSAFDMSLSLSLSLFCSLLLYWWSMPVLLLCHQLSWVEHHSFHLHTWIALGCHRRMGVKVSSSSEKALFCESL
jgi:hypothetical protein